MNADAEAGDTLQGQLLVAMPAMPDERFSHSVIYMCAHSAEGGAMGLVVNKALPKLEFSELAKQLDIETDPAAPPVPMHFGGPVETGRGFVLHSDDYLKEGTVALGNGIALTATVDVLRAMARGEGPERAILALGYAGWAPGQLEQEMQRNDWLHAAADSTILFGEPLDRKWNAALARLGIDPSLLSSQAGRA